MGSHIECFMAEPQPTALGTLRRFTFQEKSCPNSTWGHNAIVELGQEPFPLSEFVGSGRDDFPHDDPRWPTHCKQCGYAFVEEDPWQHNLNRYFLPVGKAGPLFTLREAPPGAMWYADWSPWVGPDGRALCVQTPGGDWLIDAPASNSKTPWSRTGTPPKVTAHPSIRTGSYHGWLRDGFLVEC